jgi:phytoene dehydrogenase-like protein
VLAEIAARATPVKAACLDVALSSLPRKRALVALGVDRPLYASVHSSVARLAPEGGAVIHTVNYSPSGDPRRDESELAELLDKMQPGWRGVVVERRFLPSMIVSNALVTADAGGLAGRPAPEVPSVRGLWLAGDWVGGEGMLADASLASARAAAAGVAASLRAERQAA